MAQMFIGRGRNWNHPVIRAKEAHNKHMTEPKRARQFIRVKWKLMFGQMEAKHARQKIRSEMRMRSYRGIGA